MNQGDLLTGAGGEMYFTLQNTESVPEFTATGDQMKHALVILSELVDLSWFEQC